jgi:septum site-determining protein MinC
MNADSDVQVTLRGTRDGLLIVLGDGAWDSVMRDLENQLARPNASAFFRGARVSVETGNRFLNQVERLELESILAAHNIRVGVMAPAASAPPAARAERTDMYTRETDAHQVLMIRRTLRSGQIIHHQGPVVVYGDVNDGAEIVATGDVLIFGKLRGVVHAGAGGDDHATIGAFALNPPQLRIGNFIAASSPDDKKRKTRGAEIALVREGRIVIEPWRV